MHKYLILILIFIITGCASGYKPVCRHYSVMSALTYGDYSGCIVRIATGPIVSDPNKWHAQAQAFVDGEWVWIKYKDGRVKIAKQDHFVPVKFYTVQEYLDLRFDKVKWASLSEINSATK